MIMQVQEVRPSSSAARKNIDTPEKAIRVMAELNSRERTTNGSTKGWLTYSPSLFLTFSCKYRSCY